MANVQLQPVASPVDTFVVPGVRGPVQTNWDFESLRGLSRTLDDALTQDAAIERRRIDSQVIPDNENRLATLSKDQLAVLNSADPLTKENLKALKDAGIQAADNPYALTMLRKSAAVFRIRQADYEGYLRDPQWFRQVAQVALHDPKQADSMLQQRRAQFLKDSVGPITSEFAKAAAATEFAMQETQFRKDLGRAREQLFDAEMERSTLTAVQPFVDATVREWAGDHDPALKDGTKAGFESFMAQQKSLLGPDRAEGVAARAIQNSLLALARTDGEAALHALDGLREAIGSSTMDPRLDEIESSVDREIRSLKTRGGEDAPKARAAASYRIDQALAKSGQLGTGELQDWLWKGEGQQIIEQVAKEYGIPVEQMGDIQHDKFRSWNAQDHAAQSNDAIVNDIVRTAYSGDLELARTKLLRAKPNEVTWRDRANLHNILESESKKGANSPDAKNERNEGFRSIAESFGQLPPEASLELKDLQRTYERAFNDYLNKTPDDFGGADMAARGAAFSSSQFKSLQDLRNQSKFSYLRSTPEYTNAVGGFLADLEKADLQQKLSGLDDPKTFDQTDHKIAWAAVSSEVDARMAAEYKTISQDPEVANLPTQADRNIEILRRLKGALPRVLREARGLAEGTPVTPKTLTITSEAQLQNQKTLGSLENFPLRDIDRSARLTELAGTGVYARHAGYDSEYVSAMTKGSMDAFKFILSGWKLDLSSPGATGPHRYTKDTMGTTMEIAYSAHIMDGPVRRPTEKRPGFFYATIADQIPGEEAARNLLRMRLTVRGVLPEEIISGQTKFGVPLSKIFGDGSRPWFTSFPLQQIPLYATADEVRQAVSELKEDPENSKLAQVMKALRISPEAVRKVEEWQVELASRRVGEDFGYEWSYGSVEDRKKALQALRTLKDSVDDKDPEWVKSRKQAAINFMESNGYK